MKSLILSAGSVMLSPFMMHVCKLSDMAHHRRTDAGCQSGESMVYPVIQRSVPLMKKSFSPPWKKGYWVMVEGALT
jgi:hypothetical protein